MPEVVELREVTDRRDVIHRAVRSLSSGELVALPSEAGYVIAGCALSEKAALKLTASPTASTLLLRATEETLDFLPHLPTVGQRFARRCWPGPLVLQAPLAAANGFFGSLPAATKSAAVSDDQLRVYVSSHPVLSEVAKLLRGPLLLKPAPAPTSKTDFADPLWSDVTLVVQDGPSKDTASIVRVDSTGWATEQVGAISQERLQLAACELIVFVCTGNTCRSPMAEALCRQMMSQRLKCSPQELTQRGFALESAGLAADYGCPASPESVDQMRRRGIELRQHSSQPLTERLLDHMDRCYTMTKQHRNAILEVRPDTANRVQLLARDGSDIPDPIGGGPEQYAACAACLEKHLAQVLDEVL